MPRRKACPPMEDAVALSPLFRLSPEVRNMVYTLLLVDSDSHHALFIPTDSFKRRKNEPPFRCDTCRQGFDHARQFRTHQSMYHHGDPCKPPMHKVPSISTTLLRSCRLINTEAAPLLYCANTFYFNDPHTLQQFRWRNSKLSAWVEEITVELADTYRTTKNTDLWRDYLSGSGLKKKIWRLSDDFPHLKRLTIALTNGCLLHSPCRLRHICQTFAQNLTGLDWVHVVGLNSPDVISSLKPMVCTPESRASEDIQSDLLLSELETVQTHTTEYECASGWKNAAHELGLHRDQQRHHLMEQNARLLRMARRQANHKPEDVALQEELGPLRIDLLDQTFRHKTPPLSPAFPAHMAGGYHALNDYGMQLLLLDQQRRRRQRMAHAEQEGHQVSLPLPILRQRRREQHGRLRSLEVRARHCRRPDAELSEEISKAKSAVRELQGRIEDARLRNDAAQDILHGTNNGDVSLV
ncbi:MAG: hypothetical protein L6R36_001866 [Xanthoria steineri]|nr:MAG: hypothetical protein L6R36_001866 [Xanthoria steineri]